MMTTHMTTNYGPWRPSGLDSAAPLIYVTDWTEKIMNVFEMHLKKEGPKAIYKTDTLRRA